MRVAICGLLLLTGLLSGCGRMESGTASGPKSQGRYAGIGTFDAGRLWGQMAGIPATKGEAQAQIADDEHIIVVLDSHTGEIRQCGDHSGYCVTMNPWSRDSGAAQPLPAKLQKHAADLAAEDTSTATEPAEMTNESEATN